MAMLSIGLTAQTLVDITPDPSVLEWGLQDISHEDAGRVHDDGNTMYKMRTSQKRKLNLSWSLPTASQASAILQAVNPEYFFVRYFDPLDNEFQIREMYVGDRHAPFKYFQLPNSGTRYTTLSFDLIER